MICFFLNFLRSSYQTELNNFFKERFQFPVAKQIVTKAALSKARNKLKSEAFILLNQKQSESFYDNFPAERWHGYRLLAIDGTKLRLPEIDKIGDYFGYMNPKNGPPIPMAYVSQMFDSLNGISIDSVIAPFNVGERELALGHLRQLRKKDLLLLDRGYPAFWFFKAILSRGANFCARISCTQWNIIEKFYLSQLNQSIIELKCTAHSAAKCKEFGLDMKSIKLRLIRVQLSTGETEILITSLIDPFEYPREEFMALYHERWPVEEDYKVMKCWIEVENFSGKSVLSIKQDFYAKVCSKNLTAMLAFPTREIIKRETRHREREYQINFKQALSHTKHVIVSLLTKAYDETVDLLKDLHKIYTTNPEAIKPNRTYPRLQKPKKRFYYSYKPLS